jgi:hypothetical protein
VFKCGQDVRGEQLEAALLSFRFWDSVFALHKWPSFAVVRKHRDVRN